MQKTVKIETLTPNQPFKFNGVDYVDKGSCVINRKYHVVIKILNENSLNKVGSILIEYIDIDYNVQIEVERVCLRELSSGAKFSISEGGIVYTKLKKDGVIDRQVPSLLICSYNDVCVTSMGQDVLVYPL